MSSITVQPEETLATGTGPLSGYVVLDLTRALAGPHAGMMMGDLGAKVIKIEAMGTGDDTRGWGPPSSGRKTTGRPPTSCHAIATSSLLR